MHYINARQEASLNANWHIYPSHTDAVFYFPGENWLQLHFQMASIYIPGAYDHVPTIVSWVWSSYGAICPV